MKQQVKSLKNLIGLVECATLRLIKKVLVAAIIVSVLTSVVTAQGSLEELSFKQLWEKSHLIVIGTVKKISTIPASGTIYRIVKLDVERYYKNPLEAETLYIHVEGGKIGPISVGAPDAPGFKINQSALFFLKLTQMIYKKAPVFYVFNGPAGKYKVKGDIAQAWGGLILYITEDSISDSKGISYPIMTTSNLAGEIDRLIEEHEKKLFFERLLITAGMVVIGIILIQLARTRGRPLVSGIVKRSRT